MLNSFILCLQFVTNHFRHVLFSQLQCLGERLVVNELFFFSCFFGCIQSKQAILCCGFVCTDATLVCTLSALDDASMFVANVARDLVSHCVVTEFSHVQSNSTSPSPVCDALTASLASYLAVSTTSSSPNEDTLQCSVSSRSLAMIISVAEQLLRPETDKSTLSAGVWVLGCTPMLEVSRTVVGKEDLDVCSQAVKLFSSVAKRYEISP